MDAALRHVLPATWTVRDGRAAVGGVDLGLLAERFGTPAYAVDEAHVRGRLAEYREALGEEATLVFAAKSFFCVAMAELLHEAGWGVDVVSAGELETALRGGLPPERVLLHGSVKPERETERAAAVGVGRVVIDGPGEVATLGAAAERAGRRLEVLLRLNADVAVRTHPKVTTTGTTTQFGMRAADTAAAARAVARTRGLELRGLHLHAGSQVRDLATYGRAVRALVELAASIRELIASGPIELDVGGGLAVPYRREDPAPSPAALGRRLRDALRAARATERLGPFRLLVEPGRSVVANAGVTLYRVGVRKRLADGRTALLVDGGMSDNPRPALYGARYELVLPLRADEPHRTPFDVVGRHCETGDVVARDAPLPADAGPGDLVAVLATGAYAHSMSSRYNGLPRPPVVFVRDGAAREVVRRERIDDLLARDAGLAAPAWRPAGAGDGSASRRSATGGPGSRPASG